MKERLKKQKVFVKRLLKRSYFTSFEEALFKNQETMLSMDSSHSHILKVETLYKNVYQVLMIIDT